MEACENKSNTVPSILVMTPQPERLRRRKTSLRAQIQV